MKSALSLHVLSVKRRIFPRHVEDSGEQSTAIALNLVIEEVGKEYLNVKAGGVWAETSDFHETQEYDYQETTVRWDTKNCGIVGWEKQNLLQQFFPWICVS